MKNPFQQDSSAPLFYKVGLFGPPKCGKTMAALSFPRPAVIDLERRARVYADHPTLGGFGYTQPNGPKEVLQAIDFIAQDAGKTYDTIIIDSISVYFDWLKGDSRKASQYSHLTFQDRAYINDSMRELYNALARLTVHLVIIARLAVIYETSGKTLVEKGVKPDCDKSMPHFVDYLVQMQPNYTGSITAAAGDILSIGKVIRPVTYTAFESALNVHMAPDDLRTIGGAKAFIQHWRAQGLADAEILHALGCKNGMSEWTEGRQAADIAVQAFIDGKAGDAKSGGKFADLLKNRGRREETE